MAYLLCPFTSQINFTRYFRLSPLVQEKDYVSIDPLLCNGCGLCVQVCPVEAIIQG
ncbi:MAG: 4Fe-4S binding protein [Bacillota bacterium]|nr:4Fe-4S binding protein [Bacillota bacterium]